MIHFVDSNYEEQPGPSEQTVIPEIVTDSTYWNSQIFKLFLVGEMPKEFYDLWSFCKRQCPAHPEGLTLVTLFFFKTLILFYLFRCIFISWIEISRTI